MLLSSDPELWLNKPTGRSIKYHPALAWSIPRVAQLARSGVDLHRPDVIMEEEVHGEMKRNARFVKRRRLRGVRKLGVTRHAAVVGREIYRREEKVLIAPKHPGRGRS